MTTEEVTELSEDDWRRLVTIFANTAISRFASVPPALEGEDRINAMTTRTALMAHLVLKIQEVEMIVSNSHSAMAAFAEQPTEPGPRLVKIEGGAA